MRSGYLVVAASRLFSRQAFSDGGQAGNAKEEAVVFRQGRKGGKALVVGWPAASGVRLDSTGEGAGPTLSC